MPEGGPGGPGRDFVALHDQDLSILPQLVRGGVGCLGIDPTRSDSDERAKHVAVLQQHSVLIHNVTSRL